MLTLEQGTANVIIYITTRRVGRSPLLTARDSSRSRSRSRSGQRMERGTIRATTLKGNADAKSVQIFIDRQTHQDVDEIISISPPDRVYDQDTKRTGSSLAQYERRSPFPESFVPPIEIFATTQPDPSHGGRWSPASDSDDLSIKKSDHAF